MSGAETMLPPGYAALEPFVAAWALPTLAERAERRNESTAEDKLALYHAVRGLAEQALRELDRKPLALLDAPERRLLDLLLSYAQVALSIEVRGDGEPVHARERRYMVYTREPSLEA